MGGLLDPHVFARFQKIKYNASWGFSTHDYLVNADGVLYNDPESDEFEKLGLRDSKSLLSFIKVLSLCTNISQFTISLEDSVILIRSDGSLVLKMEQPAQFRDTANQRSIKLFVESGIMNHLGSLKNVEKSVFHVRTRKSNGDVFELGQEHIQMTQDIRDEIERNWRQCQESQGPIEGRDTR